MAWIGVPVGSHFGIPDLAVMSLALTFATLSHPKRLNGIKNWRLAGHSDISQGPIAQLRNVGPYAEITLDISIASACRN